MPHNWLYDFVKTACLGKIWFSSYRPKCSRPIRLQDFLSFNILQTVWSLKFIFCMSLDIHGSFSKIMYYLLGLGLVRYARACPTFSKMTKRQYIWEGLGYFSYLVYVVTHPWKLQCYSVVLVGYGPACPKFCEITNHQYLW